MKTIPPKSLILMLIAGSILDACAVEQPFPTATAAPTVAPPRTKLKFRVSCKCTIPPSGVDDGHGVIADIPIETTIKDQLAGKDLFLDYPLEMIRNGGQNP